VTESSQVERAHYPGHDQCPDERRHKWKEHPTGKYNDKHYSRIRKEIHKSTDSRFRTRRYLLTIRIVMIEVAETSSQISLYASHLPISPV
jgi:hypothetical protein